MFCFVNGSTEKYREVRRSTEKYREVPRSTKKYREVQEVRRSTKKYEEVPRSTKKYKEVQEVQKSAWSPLSNTVSTKRILRLINFSFIWDLGFLLDEDSSYFPFLDIKVGY